MRRKKLRDAGVDVLEAVAERIAGIGTRQHEAAFEVDAQILIFESILRRGEKQILLSLGYLLREKKNKT